MELETYYTSNDEETITTQKAKQKKDKIKNGFVIDLQKNVNVPIWTFIVVFILGVVLGAVLW